MFHVALLSILLASSHAWVLQSNVDEIPTDSSQDLQLECRQDNDTGHHKTIKKINRIRILKLYPSGHITTLAVLSVRKSSISFPVKENIQVTGNLDQDKKAFLKVTLLKANRDSAGAYGCDIDLIDDVDNFVTVDVTPKIIKEKLLTLDDVEKLVQRVTQIYEFKQVKLEAEITTLKRTLFKAVSNNARLIGEKESKYIAEISSLRTTMQSKYATKDELVDLGMELKNFSTIKMISDNLIDTKKHAELFSGIQQTNKLCEDNYSEITSNISRVTNLLTTKIQSLDKNGKHSFEQVKSSVKGLAANYEKSIRRLKEELTKKLSESKCQCQTPAPTTARSQVKKESQWPTGGYGLVEAVSGCPTSGNTFSSIPYSATGFEAKNPTVKMADIVVFRLNAGRRHIPLKYCQSPEGTSTHWPKGTYCINVIKGNCPRSFSSGYMNFHFRRKKGKAQVGSYKTRHCCRSDAKPQVTMKLPSEKQFYLLRYKGTCQQVEGMAVSRHTASIRVTNGRIEPANVMFTSKHADTDKSRRTFMLCHYQHTGTT